jgi:hypothetical protein
VLVAVMDECAFFRDESSSTPDVEPYVAIKPGMLTLADRAMLVGISTPHKKSGLLWTKYHDCFGKDDPDVGGQGNVDAVESNAACRDHRGGNRGES